MTGGVGEVGSSVYWKEEVGSELQSGGRRNTDCGVRGMERDTVEVQTACGREVTPGRDRREMRPDVASEARWCSDWDGGEVAHVVAAPGGGWGGWWMDLAAGVGRGGVRPGAAQLDLDGAAPRWRGPARKEAVEVGGVEGKEVVGGRPGPTAVLGLVVFHSRQRTAVEEHGGHGAVELPPPSICA